MGQRYENNKNSVFENKETRGRISSEGRVLSEEFAPLRELNEMMDAPDDEIAHSVSELEYVKLNETERLKSEQEHSDAEKEKIAADISAEIEKLGAALSKSDNLRGFEFGQKSADAMRKTYRTEISKFKELLDELDEDFDESEKITDSKNVEHTDSGNVEHTDGKNAEFTENESMSENYNSIISFLDGQGVYYRPIMPAGHMRSSEEITAVISGGDITRGSCSSLALAYLGNRAGYNVLDFRDGKSREFFSSRAAIKQIASLPGVKSAEASGLDDFAAADTLLCNLPLEKEYYLAVGQHAAIVRNNNGQVQYLELQHPSPQENGWHDLNDYVLVNRFGASPRHEVPFTTYIIEADSLIKNREFLEILGYINTAETEQRKGAEGDVR